MMSLQIQNGRQPTLVVVEDDDIDAMALQRSLKRLKLGNKLRRARDGQEALEMLRLGVADEPWLILLDLNMPRMGGMEFLRLVRADPRLTGVVVFVLTTSKSDEDITEAYRNHIAGYICKQQSDDAFLGVADLIRHYGRIVALPITESKAGTRPKADTEPKAGRA